MLTVIMLESLVSINDTIHTKIIIKYDKRIYEYFYSLLPWNVIIETGHLVQIEYHQQSNYQTLQGCNHRLLPYSRDKQVLVMPKKK